MHVYYINLLDIMLLTMNLSHRQEVLCKISYSSRECEHEISLGTAFCAQ